MAEAPSRQQPTRIEPLRGTLSPDGGATGPGVDSASLSTGDVAARAEAELPNEIATAAAGEDDLGRILSATLERLAGFVAFSGGWIALLEGGVLVVGALSGPVCRATLGQRVADDDSPSRRVLESSEPFLCEDTEQLPAEPSERGVRPVVRSYLAVPLIFRGQTIGLLEIDATEPRAFSGHQIALLRSVALALSGPIELARRYAAEVAALENSERAQQRLAFLAQASEVLGESLDYERTLESLAWLALPTLADYCTVHVAEGDDVRLMGVAHEDPAKVELARHVLDHYPVKGDDPLGPGRVLQSGQAELYPRVPSGLFEEATVRPEHLALIRRIGMCSYMCVPLTVRGRVLGALTLCYAESERHYGSQDVALALELGRRAAAAVDNARLYRDARSAESAKAESLAFLDTLLETAPVGMAFWDHGLRFVRVNDALAEMTGLDPEQHLGRCPSDVLPGRGGEVENDLRDVLRTGHAILNRELSWETPTRPGDVRHWLTSYYPVRTDGGRMLGVGSIIADITDRKRAEQERERLFGQLEAERGRFEAVLRQLPAGVIIAEAPSGRLVMGNEQVERILRHGFLAADNIAEYGNWQGFHQDGRLYSADEWPLARSVRTGEIVAGEEIDYHFGDGTRGTVRASSAPIRDRSGAIVAGVVTFYDITARKQADRERLRLLQAEQAARAAAETAQRRLAFLAETSLAVNSALSVPERLQIITEQARDIVGVHQAAILAQVGGRADKVLSAVSLSPKYSPWRDRFTPDEARGIERLVVEGNKVVRLTEAELQDLTGGRADAAADPPDGERVPRRGWLAAPLTSRDGRNIGLLQLSDKLEGDFGEEDQVIVVQLAQMASVALENVFLFRELSQFKTTLDTTLDGVYMFDPVRLRFFYVNQGASDSVGYSPEELLEMTPFDLQPEYDESRFRALIAPLVAKRLSSATLTTSHRRKDGSTFPVELFVQYVEPPGEAGRLIQIVRDITDRVEARARLQRLAQSERALNAELKAIIRAMGQAVLVFDTEGRVIFTNPAAENLFAGGPVARFEELSARLEDPARRVLRLGEPTTLGPLELRLAEEPERWLEISAYPVFTPRATVNDDAGEEEVVETILFGRDVTEARRVRMARDAFIGVLSHELRTPVTTIYGNSKLLRRPNSSLGEAIRQEASADIEVEAERLYRLVEDLLVLARYGEGQGREAETEPLLLQRIIPAAVSAEQARWPAARFKVDIPRSLPAVEGDQTYVDQVVRNLLSNAAKYGGDSAPVQVVVTSEDETDEVTVRVIDRGPGFSPEEAERLFELFYRSPGMTAKASGAGIGLFVCKRLIEAMGGRIWAGARKGGGAEFGFALKWFNEEDA